MQFMIHGRSNDGICGSSVHLAAMTDLEDGYFARLRREPMYNWLAVLNPGCPVVWTPRLMCHGKDDDS